MLHDTSLHENHALPIRRATAVEIVAHRNKAIELYGEAHDAIAAAAEAIWAAGREAKAAAPLDNRFNTHNEQARKNVFDNVRVPKRDEFMKSAIRITDTDVWAHLIQVTELERLMDKKAKDEFAQQLMDNPPEVTVDNLMATMEQKFSEAGLIFRRGIANCFSNLDRRFKSHDGWKVGSRIILSRMLGEDGHWNYRSNERDTLQDIERTFMILEGRDPPPNYGGIVGAVEEARRKDGGRFGGARQTVVDSDFYKLRIFKNGNCHLWFKREDLVEKVNKLIGKYYGAPIPEEREAEEDTGLHNPKTTVAKNFGFFPTPAAAAKIAIEKACLSRKSDRPQLTVLEPSAGTGNLASLCRQTLHDQFSEHSGYRHDPAAVARWQKEFRFDNAVDCIEIQPELATQLSMSGKYRKVLTADFLFIQPNPAALYDRVVMNPPFDRERDIDHVIHALKFLKDDGQLVAIMSASTEFRDTKKSTAFRALMKGMGARFQDLPAGSFASVGTYCNTIVLNVWKNGTASSRHSNQWNDRSFE